MQERQYSPTASERLILADPRAVRSQRVKWLATGLATAALALFSVGCPEAADLDNPAQYCKPGGSVIAGGTVVGCTDVVAAGGTSGGTAPSGGSGPSESACETACVKKLFQTSNTQCAQCHGKVLKSAMLDLENAGLTARLKDVPSTHGDLADKSGCPTGDKLIDTSNVANSWLLKKIRGQQGTCGTPMPLGTPLSGEDDKCIETYVSCVAGAAPPAGTGGTASAAGGTASGGGGGTGGT